MDALGFRAALARRKIRIYEASYHVKLNPCKLGTILRGGAPMSPDLARRLRQFLVRFDRESSSAVNDD